MSDDFISDELIERRTKKENYLYLLWESEGRY